MIYSSLSWKSKLHFYWHFAWLLPTLALWFAIFVFVMWLTGSWVLAVLAALLIYLLLIGGIEFANLKIVRQFYANYIILLYGNTYRHTNRLRSASLHNADEFIAEFRKARAKAKGGLLVAAARALGFLLLVSLAVIGLIVCPLPPQLAEISELKRLEVGALGGTLLSGVTAGVDLIRHKGEIARVIVTFILLFFVLAFIGAAVPLFFNLSSVVGDSDSVHMWSVLAINLLLCGFDVVAVFGASVSGRRRRSSPEQEQAELEQWREEQKRLIGLGIPQPRRDFIHRLLQLVDHNNPNLPDESFELYIFCDSPMLLAFSVVVAYLSLQNVLSDDAKEGMLAGAIIVQCVMSSWLFSMVREGIVRRADDRRQSRLTVALILLIMLILIAVLLKALADH